MKVRGKVTPRMRARVFELKAEGHSLRATVAVLREEGMSLSVQGVADVLEAAERQGGARNGAGTEDGSDEERSRVEGCAGPGTGRGSIEGTIEGEPRCRVPVLPEDASPAAVAIHHRLLTVGREIDGLQPKVSTGDYSATQWAALVRVEEQLAQSLAKLLPPPPPDPAKDPTNIAAREMVHQHVLRTVEAAEARVRAAQKGQR